MSNRKEGRKWREDTNQKAPDGFSRLEVFEFAAERISIGRDLVTFSSMNIRFHNSSVEYVKDIDVDK